VGTTEGRASRLAGRSGVSTSEPSEALPGSWSDAEYLQTRCDFWHCEHGHKRSHLSFLFLVINCQLKFCFGLCAYI
jgi:hypothetical protein